ncbi:MAG: WD40 repeat domain-containing protein [Planctomycetota bacterium]
MTKTSKILLGSVIAIGVLIILALIFIRPALLRFRQGLDHEFSNDSYEQRLKENESQIKERLIASCDLSGNLIYHLDYSRDGKYIALATLSGVEIRDGENLNLIKEWESARGVELAFHPSGQLLALGLAPDGQVEIRTVPNGELIKTIYTDTDNEDWDTTPDDISAGYPDDDSVAQVSFSPDGQYLLTRTRGEWKVMVWETKDWSLKYALRKDEKFDSTLLPASGRAKAEWAQFSPDSQSVYVSSSLPLYYPAGSEKSGQRVPADQQAGWISHYDLSNGQKIRELRDEFLLGCYRFYFSPDGQKILVESVKKINENPNDEKMMMTIWELDNSPQLKWLPNIYGVGERSMDYLNTYLAIGSSSGIFTLWNIETQKGIYEVDLHGRIGELRFSSDGKKVAVGSKGSCYLFRVSE